MRNMYPQQGPVLTREELRLAIDELLVGLVPERRSSGPDVALLTLAETVGDQLMSLIERYMAGTS